MSNTIFFKEFINYKPDTNKIDEEIIVDKLKKCKDKCFHSIKFNCICDVKFEDNKKN